MGYILWNFEFSEPRSIWLPTCLCARAHHKTKKNMIKGYLINSRGSKKSTASIEPRQSNILVHWSNTFIICKVVELSLWNQNCLLSSAYLVIAFNLQIREWQFMFGFTAYILPAFFYVRLFELFPYFSGYVSFWPYTIQDRSDRPMFYNMFPTERVRLKE